MRQNFLIRIGEAPICFHSKSFGLAVADYVPMTEMQSMIGLCELRRYDNWNLARRFEYAAMYDKAFAGLKGIKAIPVNTEERKNSYWWYPILLDLNVVDIPAKQFISELIGMGIPCSGILWPESYLEQAYQDGVGFGEAHFPFKSKEHGYSIEKVFGIENYCSTFGRIFAME